MTLCSAYLCKQKSVFGAVNLHTPPIDEGCLSKQSEQWSKFLVPIGQTLGKTERCMHAEL